ncbi:hypothetical protein VSR68_36165 [Paraburkholderia phymatum]|uniref:hypothetical protein n=1 Tax=Paraburkholderia phymatum TaxID=148447 RepID=UPI003175AA14
MDEHLAFGSRYCASLSGKTRITERRNRRLQTENNDRNKQKAISISLSPRFCSKSNQFEDASHRH